jgi:hypothetical protein
LFLIDLHYLHYDFENESKGKGKQTWLSVAAKKMVENTNSQHEERKKNMQSTT